jgi:uncharacterized damage-inducible protein DinB
MNVRLIDFLVAEFAHEAETTRKHLERLPDDKLEWKPHEKSFSAIALASHIVDSLSWTDSIFTANELDFEPENYKPFQASSAKDLLAGFDERVASAKQVLDNVAEESLSQLWALKIKGNVWFEKPRAVVFRDFVLSHVIHHRGQFSLYLRLLEIPVPGSYGPSADEEFQLP